MNSNPFFSIIITTCRADYSLKKDRDKHILAQMIDNCTKQTFTDFELIIVDLLWNYRKDWIEQNYPDLDFPVLHIIDKDSPFRDHQLLRICTARNTGLLYARGECVVFSDDGQEWSENALERLYSWGRKGHGATCRLHRDNGHGPIEMDSRWAAYGIEGTKRTKIVSARGIGHFGGSLSMVPTKYMIQCNGWDEMFDGAKQLEDGDMSRRLGATGVRIALEGHCQIIEYALDKYDSRVYKPKTLTKCNGSYCYPVWDKQPERIYANDCILTDDVIRTFTRGQCTILDSDGYCSISKDKCKIKWNRQVLTDIYKDPRLVFDLEELRRERSWRTVNYDLLVKAPKELRNGKN
jgi:glycosyltransferase involved in cell wall biosynthesis